MMPSIAAHLAEFARRPSLRQKLSAKLLGARRRGKKKTAWKGIAAGGAVAAIAAIGLRGRKSKAPSNDPSVAWKGSGMSKRTPTPAPRAQEPQSAGIDNAMQSARPTNADTARKPLAIAPATPTPQRQLADGPIVTREPKARQALKAGALITPPGPIITPPPKQPSRKAKNSDRTKRRLATLAAGASSNKTGAYKNQESMLKSFRSTGKNKKSRANRNARIRRVRENTIDYSLTTIALARFARSRF